MRAFRTLQGERARVEAHHAANAGRQLRDVWDGPQGGHRPGHDGVWWDPWDGIASHPKGHGAQTRRSQHSRRRVGHAWSRRRDRSESESSRCGFVLPIRGLWRDCQIDATCALPLAVPISCFSDYSRHWAISSVLWASYEACSYDVVSVARQSIQSPSTSKTR